MIVLDTNVVSEMMKPRPDSAVRAWFNGQAAETLFLPSIALAEILFGIAALPAGRRKDALAQALDGLMALFTGRVLPFDAEAARRFAELAVKARTSGKPLSTADGYIAAIAASREFLVASRDTAPFAAAGLTVVDPWS